MADNKPIYDEWEVVDQKSKDSDEWETVDIKKKVSTEPSTISLNQKSPSESVGQEDILKSPKTSGEYTDYVKKFINNLPLKSFSSDKVPTEKKDILQGQEANINKPYDEPLTEQQAQKEVSDKAYVDKYQKKIQERLDTRWKGESPFQSLNSFKSWQNKLDEKYEPQIKQAKTANEIHDISDKYQKELDEVANKVGLIKTTEDGKVGYQVPKSKINAYENELKDAEQYALQELGTPESKDKDFLKSAYYKLAIGSNKVMGDLTNALDFVIPYKSLLGLQDDKHYTDMVNEELSKKAQYYDNTASDYINKGQFGKAIGSLVLDVVEQVPMLTTIAMGNEAGMARAVIGTEGLGAGVSKYKELEDLNVPKSAKIYNAIMTGVNFIALGEIGGNQTMQTAKNLVTKFGEDKAKELLAKSYNTSLQNVAEIASQGTSPALKGYSIGAGTQLASNIVDKITINPNKDITEGVNDAGLMWAFMDKAMTLYRDIGKAKEAIDIAKGKIPKNIPIEDYAKSLDLILDKDHLTEQNKNIDESFQAINKDKIDNINQKLNVVNQPRLVKEKINLLNKNIADELSKEYPDVNKVAELDNQLSSVENSIKVKMTPEVKELDSKIDELRKEREGLYKEDLTGAELQKQAKQEKNINNQISTLLKQKQVIKQKFYDEPINGIDDAFDKDIHRDDKVQAHDELKQVLPDIKNEEQLKIKEDEKENGRRDRGERDLLPDETKIEGGETRPRSEKSPKEQDESQRQERIEVEEDAAKEGEKPESRESEYKRVPQREDLRSDQKKVREVESEQTGDSGRIRTEAKVSEEGEEVIPEFVPEGMEETEPAGTKLVSELKIEPEYFQYKPESDAKGKTKGVEPSLPTKENPVTVWKNPNTGENIIVEGHNKFNRAKEEGMKDIPIRYIEAKTKEEALAKAAAENVKKGELEGLTKTDKGYKINKTGLEFDKEGNIIKPSKIEKPQVGDKVGFKDMVGTSRKGEIQSFEDGKYKIKADDGTIHRVKPEKLQPLEKTEKAIKEGEEPIEKAINKKIDDTKVTLAKEEIPIVSGLVKDIVKPFANWGVDFFKTAYRFLSPKSFASEQVKNILNEYLLGQRNEARSKLDLALRPMEKMFDKMSNEDCIKFIDKLKTGKDQGSQELNDVAKMIRSLDMDLYKTITEFNPNLTFKEDHYRVLWKVVPQSKEVSNILKDFNEGKAVKDIAKDNNITEEEASYIIKRATQKGYKGLTKKPIRGTRGFFKQSTLADISEGIELGGVPYSYNPITMFKMSYADGMKYITAQRMWNTLGEHNLTKFVKTGGVAPDGFSKIDDAIAKKYFPIKEAGDWWVDEGAALLINNHLRKDYIRSTEFGKGLMWLKNNFTAVELGVSAFHATAETFETISSSIAEGLRKVINIGIAQGNVKTLLKGLGDIPLAPLTPVTKVDIAKKALKFMGEKDYLNTPEDKSFIKQFPDATNLLHDYFVGGGTVGMSEDYKTNAIKTFKDSLKEKSDDPAYQYIKAGVQGVFAINEMLMKPLFDYYIPRLKLAMFLREHALSLQENQSRLEKGQITRSELARKNMAFVDDRLGEMNFDNLFWDRTFKTAMQFMFRSVTWKLGNLRAIGGAPIEQAIEFRNAYREKRPPMLTPKMAWLFGLTTLQVAASYIAQNLMAGKNPQTFKDIVAPQINKDDEKERIIMPTYFKDMLHFYHSPVKYITGSFAGDIGRFYELQQNQDFYGYEIYDPQAPISEKAKEIGQYFLPKPFSFTNLQQMKEKKEPVQKQVLSFLGFTKAPKYITNTPIENEVFDMYNMTQNLKKPHGAKEVADIKKQIKDLYTSGKQDEAYDLMTKSVSEGKLRATQTDWLLRNIDKKTDPGEYMFRMLPYDDKKYLYNKMTSEEKIKYDPKGKLQSQIEGEKPEEGIKNAPLVYKYKKIMSNIESAQKEIGDIIKSKGTDEALDYAQKNNLEKEYLFIKKNASQIEEIRRVVEYLKKQPKEVQDEFQDDVQENMQDLIDAFENDEKVKVNRAVKLLHQKILKENKEVRVEERKLEREME